MKFLALILLVALCGCSGNCGKLLPEPRLEDRGQVVPPPPERTINYLIA